MSVNLNRSLAIPPAEEKPCDLYDRCASWDLVPRAVSSFLSYSRSANLLVMCAEPGVGKTFALRSLVGSNSQTSASHLLRLRGVDPALVSKRLSRLTRQVERERLSGKEVYVGLDDVPPGDDLDVDRDVSLILRMVTAGAVVAVSVLPENELLAERLSGAIYVLSRDMLVTDILELGPGDPLYDARSLTGGIPSLAIALLRDNGGSHLDRLVAGSTYFETLGRLVGATLRSGLLDDELSVRLAMILLGRGTFEDVAGVTCVNPSEVAMGLERFAPMLGVSCHDASFRCYGVDTLDGLSASAPALSPKASAWESTHERPLSPASRHQRLPLRQSLDVPRTLSAQARSVLFAGCLVRRKLSRLLRPRQQNAQGLCCQLSVTGGTGCQGRGCARKATTRCLIRAPRILAPFWWAAVPCSPGSAFRYHPVALGSPRASPCTFKPFSCYGMAVPVLFSA